MKKGSNKRRKKGGKGGRRGRRYRKGKGYPLGKSLYTSLRYGDSKSLTTSGGTIKKQVYRLTGMYDPDLTGVGSQPRGFDQLMALYHRFCVVGTKTVIKFQNTSASLPCLVYAFTSTKSSPSITNYADILEHPKCRYKYLAPEVGGASQTTFVVKHSTKKLNNLKNVKDNPSFTGTASADPVDQDFLHIGIIPVTGSSDVQCTYTLKMDMSTLFIEPIYPNQS